MFVKWRYIVISGHLSWVVLENPIKRTTEQKSLWQQLCRPYNYIVKKLDCLPGKTIVHSLNVSELHFELKLKLITSKNTTKFSKYSHQKNVCNVF